MYRRVFYEWIDECDVGSLKRGALQAISSFVAFLNMLSGVDSLFWPFPILICVDSGRICMFGLLRGVGFCMF